MASFADAVDEKDYSYPEPLGLVCSRLRRNPEPRPRESFYWDSTPESQRTPEFYVERKEETRLEHAKRFAESSRERLSRFPAGRVLLRAEHHGDSAMDPEYWYMKSTDYEAEYWRLHWIYQERGKRMESRKLKECERQRGIEALPAASKASTTKIARQSTGRRPTTKNSRRRGRKSGQLQPQTTSPPSSIETRPRRSTIRWRRNDSFCNKNAAPTPLEIYMTPSSDEVRARYHRKHKVSVRRRCRQNAERAYRGSSSMSQAIEPISSRLRSSGCLTGGGIP
jgi:hypothetical protein